MIRCFTTIQDPAFLQGETLPDFVKTASLAPDPAWQRYPDDVFGLIVMEKDGSRQRLYPLYDKEHVWLSAKFLAKNFEGMPKTAAAVTACSVCAAAQMHEVDVPPVLHKLASLAGAGITRYYTPSSDDRPIYLRPREATFEKTASGRSASITVNGTVMPVRGPGELARGNQWFDRNHEKLAQADKYRLARFLAACAEDFSGEKLAEPIYKSREVEKTASLGDFNPQFSKHMFQRASMCQDKKLAEAYIHFGLNEKLAFVTGPLATVDAVESLDARSGLRQSYGTWVPDALSAVMTKSAAVRVRDEKAAAVPTTIRVKTATGDEDVPAELADVPVARLKKAMESDKVKRLLGPKLAAQVAANPSMFHQLPDSVLAFINAQSASIR